MSLGTNKQSGVDDIMKDQDDFIFIAEVHNQLSANR